MITAEQRELISELTALAGETAPAGETGRREFLRRHAGRIDPAFVANLCSEINRLVWADLEQARRLAGAAQWLAEALDDERCRGLADRAAANACHCAGEQDKAQKLYELALDRFQRIGEDAEAGVTRSSALLNLAYLGDYDRVTRWEEAAREAFARLGDQLRLAILDHNFANILYRQDRWEDALARYSRAYEEFVSLHRPRDAAICLRNIAVCHISLHNFGDALGVYEKTRSYCLEEGLDRLVLQVDYNIAYLYYLRGEYTRAIQRYREVRAGCEAAGDAYHKALCDLDQAEIFLELNMVDEAAELAAAAIAGFESLSLPYELAKALTNSAIALSRQGRGAGALGQLEKAREMFLRENNQLWPALLDFYRAVVLYREKKLQEASRLARAARETFSRSALATKAIMCELLLAEILLALDKPREAHEICDGALSTLGDLELPALEHQAYLVLGQVEEALGRRRAALAAYRKSHGWLERLRSQLQGEDLKIAFLSDKSVVYESLVWLTMQDPTIPRRAEMSFDYVEQARSRGLSDLLSFRAHALPATQAAHRELAKEVHALREELNWHYRQIDLQQMRGGRRSLEEVRKIRRSARQKEDELLHSLRELRTADEEFSSLQTGGGADLETVRSSLPPETVLLEYYVARNTIFGCAVDRHDLEIVPLATASRTQEIYRSLQFQLSRAMLGPEHARDTHGLIEEATQAHLEGLYAELIAPIRERLGSGHLVIVPHGFLHYVPFHALCDDGRFLIDEVSISYAPSAGVFHLCASKQSAWEDRSLVLGVADERAPLIREEARAVADSLPAATLLLGEEASEEALASLGATCRYVHIATHGLFRRDNPMFSAIQLGTSRLSLFDLYNLRLAAEMVVLSGCGTGLNAVLGADELVGLTRGLLYAGAQSVVVSLWDVNDASTAVFMRRFYRHLERGMPRAKALQRTMLEARRRYPSPYHWAPFVLVGKPG